MSQVIVARLFRDSELTLIIEVAIVEVAPSGIVVSGAATPHRLDRADRRPDTQRMLGVYFGS
ncbi:hypothetical protein [Rhodopseudomonas sp. B29]|uniref:hypothetical protein n=1 Tax=Rhodopseudomonas sp. B29 TaxID=95607 RepID=UPI00034CC7A0|nr:hypothetical protein [Rhodopseudomonas sp. B29]